MTVLIIEGPDCGGKTFAIEKISKHFKDGFLIKNLYKPISYPSEKIYLQYWRILGFIKTIKIPTFIILDRFFPSQAVYSYLRGTDEMNSHYIKELDAICADKGFIFVLLDTDLTILEKRYDMRGDEHINKEQLKLIKKRYNIFYKQTKMRKIKLDTLKENWIKKLEKVIQ